MLAALKLIKRQGYWKGEFALFWRQAKEGNRRADSCSKTEFLPLTTRSHNILIGSFGQREEATSRNGTVNSDGHLETGHVVLI